MKYRIAPLFLFSLITLFGLTQRNEDLYKYYPDGSTPLLKINTVIHVIQSTEVNPRNYTIKDTAVLRSQIELVNRFFSSLGQPTLPPPIPVEHITDSRIRFVITDFKFHVDSIGWNRKWMGKLHETNIDSVIPHRREILFLKNKHGVFKNKNHISIEDSDHNNGKYTYDSTYFDGKFSHIRVKEEIKSSKIKGNISFYQAMDNNCGDDLFKKYAADNKRALHIFITGASFDNVAFGCGPSYLFLNLTNLWPKSNWADAQITAHELGHCMGLSHTDYPQFDDLPKKDKFGWLDCDTISVSNNIMGYNKCRNYLSPKQIAYIHKLYSTDKDRMLTSLNYIYDGSKMMISSRNEEWERNMLVSGDIIIRKNKKLVVKGTVSMAAGASIILENNACLVIDGGQITNLTGGKWKGVYYVRKYKSTKPPKKKGKITIINNGKTDNSENIIQN